MSLCKHSIVHTYAQSIKEIKWPTHREARRKCIVLFYLII